MYNSLISIIFVLFQSYLKTYNSKIFLRFNLIGTKVN